MFFNLTIHLSQFEVVVNEVYLFLHFTFLGVYKLLYKVNVLNGVRKVSFSKIISLINVYRPVSILCLLSTTSWPSNRRYFSSRNGEESGTDLPYQWIVYPRWTTLDICTSQKGRRRRSLVREIWCRDRNSRWSTGEWKCDPPPL